MLEIRDIHTWALRPALLCLDEPTSGVSTRDKAQIMDTISSVVRAGEITAEIYSNHLLVSGRYNVLEPSEASRILDSLAHSSAIAVAVVVVLGGGLIGVVGRADFPENQIAFVVARFGYVRRLSAHDGFSVAHQRSVAVGVVFVLRRDELTVR